MARSLNTVLVHCVVSVTLLWRRGSAFVCSSEWQDFCPANGSKQTGCTPYNLLPPEVDWLQLRKRLVKEMFGEDYLPMDNRPHSVTHTVVPHRFPDCLAALPRWGTSPATVCEKLIPVTEIVWQMTARLNATYAKNITSKVFLTLNSSGWAPGYSIWGPWLTGWAKAGEGLCRTICASPWRKVWVDRGIAIGHKGGWEGNKNRVPLRFSCMVSPTLFTIMWVNCIPVYARFFTTVTLARWNSHSTRLGEEHQLWVACHHIFWGRAGDHPDFLKQQLPLPAKLLPKIPTFFANRFCHPLRPFPRLKHLLRTQGGS
ncbi:unnamed protein product [Durusdinium trenchii]|uniref:Uncharacterized protein n=1 Tax=Durusdinium trenchii TaxID=1381693 RepID=A0ABP0QAI7_9DINO